MTKETKELIEAAKVYRNTDRYRFLIGYFHCKDTKEAKSCLCMQCRLDKAIAAVEQASGEPAFDTAKSFNFADPDTLEGAAARKPAAEATPRPPIEAILKGTNGNVLVDVGPADVAQLCHYALELETTKRF